MLDLRPGIIGLNNEKHVKKKQQISYKSMPVAW